MHYEILAKIFRYPDKDYKENVESCTQWMSMAYPEAEKMFAPFATFVKNKSFFEVEEVFAKTFHIQAICYLDLGYVLFQEDYKRGEFLVGIKNEQIKAGNDCGEELADNLPNVLKLISLPVETDFRNELTVRIMIPALKKMLVEFEGSRIALRQKLMKKKDQTLILPDLPDFNIYEYAIKTLLMIMEDDFRGISFDQDEIKADLSADFTKSCGSCGTN